MRGKHVEHKKQAIHNVIYVRNKCSSNLKSRYFDTICLGFGLSLKGSMTKR